MEETIEMEEPIELDVFETPNSDVERLEAVHGTVTVPLEHTAIDRNFPFVIDWKSTVTIDWHSLLLLKFSIQTELACKGLIPTPSTLIVAFHAEVKRESDRERKT